MSAFDRRFLIICGAEKCGTTSLFAYLSSHPSVCASSKKETDYFRGEVTNLEDYLRFFDAKCAADALRVESSPAYMAEADAVAPRIAALAPQARCLFILRDPLDRLRSCFRFYKSRLHVPDSMSFEQFTNHCLAFESEGRGEARHGIKPWHLRALARGRYEQQLAHFSKHVPEAQRLTLLYDDLRDDMSGAMRQVCAFAALSADFYEHHTFARENVSFLARHRSLQRAAIFVNDKFEAIWRRNPSTKRTLLGLYKRLNERSLERDDLSPSAADNLRDWYAPTYELLAQFKGASRQQQAPVLSA